MYIPWDDARLFLAIAETRSVSAAARKLKITQPTASRRLAQLEALVGEAIVTRSVTGATLTSFGERLLEPARRMAEYAGEFERVAEGAETSVEGVVRITAPPGLAFDLCVPFAAWLRERLPRVRLEVISTVRYLDLTRREADLALRFARPSQQDLSIICSRELDAVPFAARTYAARLGARAKPADVNWVGWAPPLQDMPPNDVLGKIIPGFKPSFSSDDFLIQFRAAELGLGAIFLARMRHRFSRATPLVEISVEGISPVRGSLHLICAKSAMEVPRIRAVAELLSAELKAADTRRATKAARR